MNLRPLLRDTRHVCFTHRRSRTLASRRPAIIAGARCEPQTPIAQTATHMLPTCGVRTSSPSLAYSTPCTHVRPSVSATNVELCLRRGAALIYTPNTTENASSASWSITHCSPTRAMFVAWAMFPKQLTDGMPACPDVTIKRYSQVMHEYTMRWI